MDNYENILKKIKNMKYNNKSFNLQFYNMSEN